MAKQNTSKMVATYTTDFNTTVTNIPVRWSSQAPEITGFYADRVAGCGAARLAFSPRYIKATFANGVHKYVVPATSNISTMKTALITAGALCLDLYGETWNRVPNSVLNDPAPTPKAAPYAAADITGFGDKETGTFDYTSEVFGLVKAGYAAEAAPVALLTAAKAGLVNSAAGTGVQNRDSLNIEPRHFLINADVDDDTRIVRRANLSLIGELANYADNIAPAGYYLSYRGEDAFGLHLV